MSFDAWVVGFGLSRVLIDLKLVGNPMAYSGLWAAGFIDACILYVYFGRKTGRLSLSYSKVTASAMEERDATH